MTYVLLMNPVMSRAEDTVPVARSENRDQLVKMLADESVPMYKEGETCKFFKKGGPLENYNRPVIPYGTTTVAMSVAEADRAQLHNGTPCVIDCGDKATDLQEAIAAAEASVEDKWNQIQALPEA